MSHLCASGPHTGQSHRWDIPPHEADTSDISRPACEPGRCRWCGAERKFTNALIKGCSWSIRGTSGKREQSVRGGLTAQKRRRK